MKRKIFATITIGKGKVSFSVMEKISTETVGLFASTDSIDNARTFIRDCKIKIEANIGGKLKDVMVVIEPTHKVEPKIELVKEKLNLANGLVSKDDINNILAFSRQSLNTKEANVILVQPFRFEVENTLSKKYSEAPIGKKGKRLLVTSAVTTISTDSFNYLHGITQSCGLNITQIFLSPQTIIENNVDRSRLEEGVANIHIGKSLSHVAIAKHNTTVKISVFEDLSFDTLIDGIAKVARCNNSKAKDLLHIYGSFETTNRVIKEVSNEDEGFTFTVKTLQNIITKFLDAVIKESQKIIGEKQIDRIPFVVSGKLSKVPFIDNYLRSKLGFATIVYKNRSYIEKRDGNITCMGAQQLLEFIDNTIGNKSIKNIVDTNPETIDTILVKTKLRNKRTWITSWLSKGGTNVR